MTMQYQPSANLQPLKAALYCRISKDRIGAGLGVERQEGDCRGLARQHGHDVGRVIVDNDMTAYKAAHREGFEELLCLTEAGEVDVVIAWHTDRLYRDSIDLERLINVCDLKNIPILTVKAGALDLSTASGRMAARIYCAVQKHEVEHSIERVKAAKLQAAQAGRWSGGQRPFGYTKGCKEIYEPEAAVVRKMAHAVIDGRSFNSVALDLNAQGITTQHGKKWAAVNVRNLLLHARYAGLRQHHDAVYPAEWPAVLSMQEWEDLQIAIKNHAAKYKQQGPARKFLLTGYAHCGNCGNRMNTCPRERSDGTMVTRYTCRKKNHLGESTGCGKMYRLTAPTDHFVGECIIYRLESYDFDKAVAATETTSEELRDAMKQQRLQMARLQEIRNDYATGAYAKDEYQQLAGAAQTRLDELDRKVCSLSTKNGVRGLVTGHRARSMWESASLQQRRAVVEILIDRVTIKPSDTRTLQKGQYYEGWKFRPEDVAIAWRV